MILREIYTYVKENGKAFSEAEFLERASSIWAEVWYSSDLPDALFEYDIAESSERVIILPWFVYQLKGVKPSFERPRRLESPRPYYNDNASFQSHYEWRMLHRTPLLQSLSAAGQLTFRPRKVLPVAVTIAIRGAGQYGVVENEQITLPANTEEVTSAAVYFDVSMLSKSIATTADIEVFDLNDNIVAILPSDRTDVFCQVVRLLDREVTVAVRSQNTWYTILYKAHPPQYTSLYDTIPTEYGLVLRRALVANVHEGRSDKESQDLADRIGNRADDLLAAVRTGQEQSVSNKLDIASHGPRRRYHGYL